MPKSSKPPRKAKRKSTLALHLAKMRGRLSRDQEGATAIEYALIASGVGAAVAATVWSLGTTTNALYASVGALF